MTEKKNKKVEIPDLHPDVVAEMLQYIYTGNTPNLSRLAGELLAAAEQYQLEQLKSICEERLCATLEIGNSVNHLVLGDMYQVIYKSKSELVKVNFIFHNIVNY